MSKSLFILLWLVYFILPYDLFPDFLPFGRLDDIVLLALLYWNFFRNKSGQRPTPGMGTSSGTGNGQRPFDEGYSNRGRESQAESAQGSEGAKNPYDILNVARSASPEEIHQAYRQQASRYHPDKVAHLGEEFQELAKLKFQDIQWAYETLTRNRGGG